jgi:ADP-ribose pyrophosphatase YjhB (NUDIX family)
VLVRHEVQAVIFNDAGNLRQVLILKTADFSARRYRWRLLKGGVKEGETEVEALQREIFEETGLKSVKILEKVHAYEFGFRDIKHKVSSYLVKADREEPIKLQKSEVADCLWTTKEKALQMLYWNNEKDALNQLR